MNTKPGKWTHDCDACVLIGTAFADGTEWDLYECHGSAARCDQDRKNGRKGGTAIARWSSEPSEYHSAPISVLPEVAKLGAAWAICWLWTKERVTEQPAAFEKAAELLDREGFGIWAGRFRGRAAALKETQR